MRVEIEPGGSGAMGFVLHPRLMADSAVIVDWSLSRVLLMNDKRFPWIILVPRRPNIVELFDLDSTSRTVLTNEIARAAESLKRWAGRHGGCDKINVGMIGNMVPQLHVHVVARKKTDSLWPGTVWGAGQAEHYGAAELMRVVSEIRDAL